MPKDVSQLAPDIMRVLQLADTLVELLKKWGVQEAQKIIEEELGNAKSARTPEAIQRRPGTGYDKLIQVAKDSVEIIETGIGIGKFSTLDRFTNPAGQPLWRFFEYGTYKKGAGFGFWPVEKGAPGGIYGEGISLPVSKGVRPHPPMPGIFYLQLSAYKVTREIKAKIPAEMNRIFTVKNVSTNL